MHQIAHFYHLFNHLFWINTVSRVFHNNNSYGAEYQNPLLCNATQKKARMCANVNTNTRCLRLHLHPLDLAFRLLSDELDTAEHVGDVIHPPLKGAQSFCGLVEVENSVRSWVEQIHEALGEPPERYLGASSGGWEPKKTRFLRSPPIYRKLNNSTNHREKKQKHRIIFELRL